MLGSGSFIPNEEQVVVGAAGEEVRRQRRPEEYQAEELAGGDATFKIKLHRCPRLGEPPNWMMISPGDRRASTINSWTSWKDSIRKRVSSTTHEKQADQEGRGTI